MVRRDAVPAMEDEGAEEAYEAYEDGEEAEIEAEEDENLDHLPDFPAANAATAARADDDDPNGSQDEDEEEDGAMGVGAAKVARATQGSLKAKREKADDILVKQDLSSQPLKKPRIDPARPLTGPELFRESKKSEASARDLTCKAICRIKHGLRQPGAQGDGRPFIPEDWDTTFKPSLGSYKKFLLGRPDQFRIVAGSEPGLFTVETIFQEPIVAPSWEALAKAKGKGKWNFSAKGKGKTFDSGKGKGKGKDKGKDKGKFKGKDKGKDAAKGNFKGSTPWPKASVSGAAEAEAAMESMPEGKPFGGGMTELSKRVTSVKAIKEIKKGLQTHPASVQAAVGPFEPPDWETRFRPTLGVYKQFLLAHPEHFSVTSAGQGSFVVRLAGQAGGSRPPTRAAALLAEAAREELAAEEEEQAAAQQVGFEVDGEQAKEEDEIGQADGEEWEEEGAGDEGAPLGADAAEAADGDDPAWEEDSGEAVAAAPAAEETAFPAERPTKHGLYINTLLSGGLFSGFGGRK